MFDDFQQVSGIASNTHTLYLAAKVADTALAHADKVEGPGVMAKKLIVADFCAQQRSLESIRRRMVKWGKALGSPLLINSADDIKAAIDKIGESCNAKEYDKGEVDG